MNRFVRCTGVLLLLSLSGGLSANEEYRIAGIIAQGKHDWRAIVELPDGEQRVVTAGDYLGQVEVVQISQQGVILQFPGGKQQMQLSQGDYITQPGKTILRREKQGDQSGYIEAAQIPKQDTHRSPAEGSQTQPGGDSSARSDHPANHPGPTGEGVAVDEFSKMVNKKLDPGLLAGVTGLETLGMLSDSARIVAYSYVGDVQDQRTPINSLESGVELLHQAIVEETGLRITVEGDESFQDFYVMPLPPGQN
jgi:hypothetical protein